MLQYAQENSLANDTDELKLVGTNGKIEVAEDSGGVFHDGVTEFLDSFYMQYCIGDKVKVPVIRPDMDESKWMLCMAWRQ